MLLSVLPSILCRFPGTFPPVISGRGRKLWPGPPLMTLITVTQTARTRNCDPTRYTRALLEVMYEGGNDPYLHDSQMMALQVTGYRARTEMLKTPHETELWSKLISITKAPTQLSHVTWMAISYMCQLLKRPYCHGCYMFFFFKATQANQQSLPTSQRDQTARASSAGASVTNTTKWLLNDSLKSHEVHVEFKLLIDRSSTSFVCLHVMHVFHIM